jgi:hypothetical protein
MTPPRCALAAAAAALLAVLSAACAEAAPATLCDSQTAPVAGGAYAIGNNEWGSSAPECITTGPGTAFTVVHSSIANATDGPPGGYPSIYKGCHWGACTQDSGFPVQASAIQAGLAVSTSWRTTQPGGSSVYNAAYDIWFNRTPAASGKPNGAELMIWLNQLGPVHPAGSLAVSDVTLGGRSYNVWLGGRRGRKTISYTMISPATSVSRLNLQPLVADAVRRGWIEDGWYLTDVEAGFEIWQGGEGLATTSFSVAVAPG